MPSQSNAPGIRVPSLNKALTLTVPTDSACPDQHSGVFRDRPLRLKATRNDSHHFRIPCSIRSSRTAFRCPHRDSRDEAGRKSGAGDCDESRKAKRKAARNAHSNLHGRCGFDCSLKPEALGAKPQLVCPVESRAGSPLPAGRVDLSEVPSATVTLVSL